jgi:hypothetical protein
MEKNKEKPANLPATLIAFCLMGFFVVMFIKASNAEDPLDGIKWAVMLLAFIELGRGIIESGKS